MVNVPLPGCRVGPARRQLRRPASSSAPRLVASTFDRLLPDGALAAAAERFGRSCRRRRRVRRAGGRWLARRHRCEQRDDGDHHQDGQRVGAPAVPTHEGTAPESVQAAAGAGRRTAACPVGHSNRSLSHGRRRSRSTAPRRDDAVVVPRLPWPAGRSYERHCQLHSRCVRGVACVEPQRNGERSRSAADRGPPSSATCPVSARAPAGGSPGSPRATRGASRRRPACPGRPRPPASVRWTRRHAATADGARLLQRSAGRRRPQRPGERRRRSTAGRASRHRPRSPARGAAADSRAGRRSRAAMCPRTRALGGDIASRRCADVASRAGHQQQRHPRVRAWADGARRSGTAGEIKRQGADQVGALRGHDQCDRAAHRVADQVHRAAPDGLQVAR